MLVTIIIPVYNGEKYIARIYESIKKQTYKNIELIFFNDASTDNSLKILNKLKSENVKIYSSKKNFGPGGAKNEGLLHATGEYVLFIDCDDDISNDYVQKLVKNAKCNNYPDIVLSNFTNVNIKNDIQNIRDYKIVDKAMTQKISSVGKLIKLKYIQNNNISLPYGKVLEDVLLHSWLMCTKATYSYSDTAGYYYIFNENSISHTTLKTFNKDSLKNGMNYLIDAKNKIEDISLKNKMDYYTFKYLCWHLLKSGNKVGSKAMMDEYNTGLKILKENFPKYKKIRNLQFKNERTILKFVIFTILIMHYIHLDKLFFKFYSNVNLEKFWPSL